MKKAIILFGLLIVSSVVCAKTSFADFCYEDRSTYQISQCLDTALYSLEKELVDAESEYLSSIEDNKAAIETNKQTQKSWRAYYVNFCSLNGLGLNNSGGNGVGVMLQQCKINLIVDRIKAIREPY